jgi:pimeloyl-ACP methyl ester carboxylesterase
MSPQPFRIDIPQSKLDDLHRRLDHVNWPHDFENDDWTYGVPRSYLEELVRYWREDFDWRAREAEMNELAHFRTEVDGLTIHYIHERGHGPNPIPIVLSHGWPWTFWDLKDVIPGLVDPAAHGGDLTDSFDVIVPSLPGFIFSTPLERSGVGPLGTADLWDSLMRNTLGYERYAAQGGDWGAMITTQLGHKYAENLIGIHLTNAAPVPSFGGDRPWSIVSVGGAHRLSKAVRVAYRNPYAPWADARLCPA